MSRLDSHSVLKRPLVFTEKLTQWREDGLNKVMFEVAREANKQEIKRAIEELFEVTVEKVNTTITRGASRRVGRRLGRRPNIKKAVVTLKAGDDIDDYFGGV
jgi:large subunit ribosomal protein L23